MAASTVDRQTPAMYIQRQSVIPLANAAVIPAGVLVCHDANGLAVNGAEVVGLTAAGRSAHAADQTKGDDEIVVDRGVFGFAMSAGLAAAAQANCGKTVVIIDNQTVGLASETVTADIVAGVLEQVIGNVAYVRVGL